jgi:dCMP deaminase
MSRVTWDNYFIEIMHTVAKRATCDRGRSGCIIVRDKQIISTGYVGSPPGLPHCDDIGHLMREVINEEGGVSQHCVRTIHAEQNAICQAAKHGVSLKGATLYCKMEPCRVCAMMIISVGIDRVVALRKYHAAQESREMFEVAGVQLDVLEQKTESYSNQ